MDFMKSSAMLTSKAIKMEKITGREKWKGSLTDRERFKRQMHHQSVDRCFNWEFGYWDDNFQKWPLFRDNGIRDNAAADRFLNFDVIHTLSSPWMHPRFDREVISESAQTHIIRNEEGLIAEVPSDGHGTIPHFIKSSIETPDDWYAVKEARFKRDDPARMVDIAAWRKAHPDNHEYVLCVDTGSRIGKIRDLMTVEGLAYACYDFPEMVEDMVETTCLLTEDFLDQVLPHLAFDAAWGWEDICYKSGPLVSLGFFREIVVPRYRRIGRKLREHGIDIWLTDCDGDVRLLIDDWLETGLNTLFPLEVNCSGHPGELLDAYGRPLRIMGGVDKMALIAGKSAIRKYLESLLPWVHRGGFIPHCDHRCPPDVSQDNYLYYLDLKEELFGRLEITPG